MRILSIVRMPRDEVFATYLVFHDQINTVFHNTIDFNQLLHVDNPWNLDYPNVLDYHRYKYDDCNDYVTPFVDSFHNVFYYVYN